MSLDKPNPGQLRALWILMTAQSWGAAIAAIAEGEPEVVKLIDDHDREVAKAAVNEFQHLVVTALDFLPSGPNVPEQIVLHIHDLRKQISTIANQAAAKAIEDAADAINAQDATQGCALAPLWRSHNFVEWLRSQAAAIRRGE